MKLRRNLSSKDRSLKQIAIFASGAGTNAKNIIAYFKNNSHVKIELIVSNKPDAGVLQIARDHNVASILVNKELPLDADIFLRELKKRSIDLIVLAGFPAKIPPALILAFPKKIVNIHPALLPAYGGKGMYGMHVHEAVISNKEKQSGISIHYVDEIYDHGEIIFQSTCEISPGETPDTLAQKIHFLEHTWYPIVIDEILKKQKTS